ncbi:hypothetical protein E2I00_018377, partial [Balaenoptera physalus]
TRGCKLVTIKSSMVLLTEEKEMTEREYFYPKYLGCLGSFRAGLFTTARLSTNAYPDLRSCVNDQCNPLPCNEDGYMTCRDGQATFTCICKSGWQGEKCEFDINECKDPSNVNGGCNQICDNTPGSYHCSCKSGFVMLSNKKDCRDVDECSVKPSICGTAVCKNIPGDFECECTEGYRYNPISKSCEDVDECSENICAQLCVNHPGGYSCYCDGKKGFKLAQDQKSCEAVPVCLPLNLDKNYELLYLAEQFVGVVLYLKFRLPEITRFSAEFDFRTYDSEGVILYAESSDQSAWFLIALREGKIEIQFKNEYTAKITTGGKVINDGLWNMINPRLDGCIRGWNLMNQGASGVKEIIQEKQNKHCLVNVEKGSYYPGSGVAQFSIDYTKWKSCLQHYIHTVEEDILVSVENMVIARIEALSLCSNQQSLLEIRVNRNNLELLTQHRKDSFHSEDFQRQFAILDKAMKETVATYLGGLPDVPFSATPVNAFYNGCMEVNVNGVQLDLDEAISKHNDIRAHSCPSVWKKTKNT